MVLVEYMFGRPYSQSYTILTKLDRAFFSQIPPQNFRVMAKFNAFRFRGTEEYSFGYEIRSAN